MKEETNNWMKYADENLESAQVLFDSDLLNPCLQNIQQSVEKALKALLIEHSIKFYKTHSISELKNILEKNDIKADISDDECELLDSIYLPSKYPVLIVLPDFVPDRNICLNGIKLASRVRQSINSLLKN
jgi:HEPN domain-containing protein